MIVFGITALYVLCTLLDLRLWIKSNNTDAGESDGECAATTREGADRVLRRITDNAMDHGCTLLPVRVFVCDNVYMDEVRRYHIFQASKLVPPLEQRL